MNGVIVVVVKPGIYLDAEWRALPEAAEGATITVAGGAYADSLIADGHVALPTEAPVEPEPPTMPVELEPVKKKATK